MSKRKISIFRYIVENEPEKANKLLADNGIPVKRITSTVKKVNAFKKLSSLNKSPEFVKSVLEIHPDRKYFDAVKSEIEVNASGEESWANLEGQTEKPKEQVLKDQNKNIKLSNYAIAGLIGVGATIALVGLIKMLK